MSYAETKKQISFCEILIYGLALYGIYAIYDKYFVGGRFIPTGQNGYKRPLDLEQRYRAQQYHAVVPRHFEKYPINEYDYPE